jgi:hypothetical protein
MVVKRAYMRGNPYVYTYFSLFFVMTDSSICVFICFFKQSAKLNLWDLFYVLYFIFDFSCTYVVHYPFVFVFREDKKFPEN